VPHLIPPSDCDRARESVSCRLDGELSELEATRLDDHLRDCAECSAYARESHALAYRLRTSALEQPEVLVFVPVRRRPLVRLQTAAAAAAVMVVAAGSSFVVGRAVGIHGAGHGLPVAAVSADFLGVQADSTRQHVLAMLPRLAPSRTLRAGRAIAV
jgi:predicted anti-sigma-YlaC factor YlaD